MLVPIIAKSTKTIVVECCGSLSWLWKKSPKFSMLVSETAAQFLSQLTKEFLQNPLTTYPELEVTH